MLGIHSTQRTGAIYKIDRDLEQIRENSDFLQKEKIYLSTHWHSLYPENGTPNPNAQLTAAISPTISSFYQP